MISLAVAFAVSVAAALAGADLEREARAIEALLIAPCCFSQQVSVHQSEAAAEVRRDVRARLATGQTREQILEAYVSRYGKRVLAEPPAAGFDLTLHLMPFALLLASVGLAVAVYRRFFAGRAGHPRLATAAPVPGAAVFERRLDDELRDLD